MPMVIFFAGSGMMVNWVKPWYLNATMPDKSLGAKTMGIISVKFPGNNAFWVMLFNPRD